jgi:hypothetical protein
MVLKLVYFRNGMTVMVNWYQRRTLTGTGVTKKTAPGCTAKNLRREVASLATAAFV